MDLNKAYDDMKKRADKTDLDEKAMERLKQMRQKDNGDQQPDNQQPQQ